MANAPIKYGAQLGQTGRRIYDFINKWYPKAHELYVTSAYRPNDGGSHHSGLTYNGSNTAAVDYGARDHGYTEGNRRMRDLSKWIYDNFWDLSVEIIHTTESHGSEYGFYVKNQRKVGPYAAADHGNHLHYATSGALLDKMEARARQKWGTPAQPPPTQPGGKYDDTVKLLYGWDASDFDWDRGARPSTVARAAAEGIKFFTHKITDGTGVVHVHAGEMVKAAVSAKIPFVGFYVVPRTPGNNGHGAVSVQVSYAIAEADKQWPQWRSFPGFFWQVDLEHWEYDKVAPRHGVEMAELFKARTGKGVVLYAPKWSYGDSIPGSHALWASNYGNNAAQGFKTLYANSGGSGHAGWGRYSGRVPRILQYGSRAVIGGQHTTDANAFKGSEVDFAKMIGAPLGAPSTKEEDLMIFGKTKDSDAVVKALGDNTYVGMENWSAVKRVLDAGAGKLVTFDSQAELEFAFGKKRAA